MVVHDLTRQIWQMLSAHVAHSHSKGGYPKISSCDPSTLRVMNFICQPHNILWQSIRHGYKLWPNPTRYETSKVYLFFYIFIFKL